MKHDRPLLPDTGFVRLRQVLAVIPISSSGWWDGVKKGKFPPGLKLGAHTTVWGVEDIRELIRKIKAGEAL